MTKETIFSNLFLNVFILFINTSVSDAFFETFFIPASFISITRLITNIIFILIVLYYLLTERIKVRRYLVVIVFVVFIGITVLWGPKKFEAIKVYINFLGPCSYFILLFCISTKNRIIKILKTYCDVIVFTNIIALVFLSKVGYMGSLPSEHVVRGIHLSRSTMIIYLNFCIFIYLYYIRTSLVSYKDKINVTIMLILNIILILLSKSSTGIVTIVLFIPLLAIAKYKSLSKFLIRASIIIGISLPVIKLTSPFLDRIIKTFFGKTLTFSGRTYIWNYALDKLVSNPLLGNGFNSTHYLLENKIIPSYERVAAHTHNGFLELFLQSGFIGLLLGVIIILIAFRYTFKINKKEGDIIRIYFIVFMIFNFMEPYILGNVSVITLWLPVIYVITLANNKIRVDING